MLNFLSKTNAYRLGRQLLRSASYPAAQSKVNSRQLHAEILENRSLLRVSGAEAQVFLQGLITNDMAHLHGSSATIYALFLNKAGRILYDSLIYRSPHLEHTFLIECDSAVVTDLAKHLKLFRVRRKIAIDPVDTEFDVWVVHNGRKNAEPDTVRLPTTITEPTQADSVILSQDPRLKNLGIRMIAPKEFVLEDVNRFFPEDELQLTEDDEDDYTTLRYRLGIGEGIVDHIPTKSFPIESNGDYLHGVSFQKGCYLGQELTARSYHTGVIRKRLMPVRIASQCEEDEPKDDVQIAGGGASVGKMRGQKNGYGLALLRIEKVANHPDLLWNDIACSVTKPFWWPSAAPRRDTVTVEQQS